jgi:penicillin amidase
MKDIIKILILLFLVLFSIHILNNKIFLYSPMGKLLNPFHGYSISHSKSSSIFLSNVDKVVEVIWDNNNVPHIFAENDYDLYMVQGYVVAQDRLWQMDFITRLHAGRLSICHNLS